MATRRERLASPTKRRVVNVRWRTPARIPAASFDEVHVWRVRLDRGYAEASGHERGAEAFGRGRGADASRLERDLAPDERKRADSFRFAIDRARFVTARASLRRILGAYSGTEPGRIKFAYGAQGKPELIDGDGLRFNASHSGELALIAVARGRRVGIDVERVRGDVSIDEVAALVFSDREREELERSGAGAFFALWTCKEAVMKAVGAGVSLPPRSIEVSLSSGRPMLVSIRGDVEKARRWSLETLAPGRGYAGAVVVEGTGWRTRCLQWPVRLTWPERGVLGGMAPA